jgi:hypothetical protein
MRLSNFSNKAKRWGGPLNPSQGVAGNIRAGRETMRLPGARQGATRLHPFDISQNTLVVVTETQNHSTDIERPYAELMDTFPRRTVG